MVSQIFIYHKFQAIKFKNLRFIYFLLVYTTFLDDLHKPLIEFKVLKDMQSDFRAIPVSTTKILAKIEKWVHSKEKYLLENLSQSKVLILFVSFLPVV